MKIKETTTRKETKLLLFRDNIIAFLKKRRDTAEKFYSNRIKKVKKQSTNTEYVPR